MAYGGRDEPATRGVAPASIPPRDIVTISRNFFPFLFHIRVQMAIARKVMSLAFSFHLTLFFVLTGKRDRISMRLEGREQTESGKG